MSDLILTGLDGTNPLGFFAALGVMEALAGHGVPAKLRWGDEGGWRPVLAGVEGDLHALVDLIDEDRRACINEPALDLEYQSKRDLKPRPSEFRTYLATLVENSGPNERRGVDWASAFATDIAVDNNGNTKPTAFHFTAGQQQFLKMVGELATGTTPDDLLEALVGPWNYQRPLPVMGWDSTIARDYALRASDPSGDKKLGVPGADWLAVRGLPSLPVVPVKNRVKTTGCVGGWKTGRFRWGLWTVPLCRETIRSTVRLDLDDMRAEERTARGIGVVLSCGIKRHDTGGRGTFEPAAIV